MENQEQDQEKEQKGGKSMEWISTLFGALAYIIAKYAIFEGNMSFLGGVLSFIVGSVICYGVIFLFSKK